MSETTPRYPLGPCVDCDEHSPDVQVIPAVPQQGNKKMKKDVLACPRHAPAYISRSHDLDWLARRRSASTGETFEQALTVLKGIRQQTLTANANS